MKLSIVIPTLNEEGYIGKAINSIREQDFKDLEIIVTDARSDDQTKQEVKKHKDVRLIEVNKRNVSLQRNMGAEHARGEILMFMDADIIFPREDVISRFVRAFDDPSVAAATCKVHVHPKEETLADKCHHMYTNFVIRSTQMLGFGTSRGACQAMRKDIFTKIKGYNPEIYVAEDTELFSRLVKHGKLRFVDACVYESTRRYRKEGYLKTIWLWTINGLWVFFTGRSFSKRWKPVR